MNLRCQFKTRKMGELVDLDVPGGNIEIQSTTLAAQKLEVVIAGQNLQKKHSVSRGVLYNTEDHSKITEVTW